MSAELCAVSPKDLTDRDVLDAILKALNRSIELQEDNAERQEEIIEKLLNLSVDTFGSDPYSN